MAEDFYEQDEGVDELLEVIAGAIPAKTLPSAAFMRQVRDAVGETYMGGSFETWPQSVQKYCEPDGGLLNTLDVAITLLEEREAAETDPNLIDALARWLDAYGQPERHGRWTDDPPEGWNSQEDLREAYRLDAVELLHMLLPGITQTLTDRLSQRLLPKFRDIVVKNRAGDI